MNIVKVKNLAIGEGAPKIIASIMGHDIKALLAEAEYYNASEIDIVELRIDYFDQPQNIALVQEAIQKLKAAIIKPLLFTFRTAKEGGEKEILAMDYIALNKAIVNTGLVEMIDLELFTGDELIKDAIEHAHAKGVKVIISSHDFHKTPLKEEIIKRLCKMQELGADIPKIALMPQSKSDVLTLLEATLEMHEKHADRPIITMSMSPSGVVSRLTGEVFGSAATFGAVKKVSAPGQINTKDLRLVLDIFHNL